MKWPTHADYQETIQNPSFCLKDPELKSSSVACNMLGLPKVMSGNFASVYELSHEDVRWAVRCFVRQVPNQHKHYALLSQHLGSIRPECLVGFEYILEGIQLHGRWYPIVKMDWVKGDPLNVFLEDNHEDPDMLLSMAQAFRELVNSLIIHQISHGDLQHGNIMVTPDNQLKLVDYDGMYVPPLGQIQSPELGHANYQHPKRTPHFYNSTLDRFSALVVYTSLRALAADAGLWSRFYCGENLIFTADDFKNPDDSKAFEALLNSPDPTVSKLTQLLRRSSLGHINEVAEFELMVNAALSPNPLPESLLRTPEATPAMRQGDTVWWEEEKEESELETETVSRMENDTAVKAFRTGDTGIVVRDWTHPAPLNDDYIEESSESQEKHQDSALVTASDEEHETSPILWVTLSLAAAGISFMPGLHLLVGAIGALIGVFSWTRLPGRAVTHRAVVGAAIVLSGMMVAYGLMAPAYNNPSVASKERAEVVEQEAPDVSEAISSVYTASSADESKSILDSSGRFSSSSPRMTSDRAGDSGLLEFVLSDSIASGVGEIWSIQLSPKEEWLAIGGNQGEVVVWSWPGNEPQQTIAAHSSGVVDIAFSPDQRMLITAGKDKKVKFWNLRSGSLEKEHIDSAWSFFPTQMAPDARLMVASSQNHEIANIFEPTSKFLIRTLDKHSSWISTLELSYDGEWIMTISGDDSIRLIRTKTGEVEQIWIGDRNEEGIAISPDGKKIVFSNNNHEIEARSVVTGKLIQTYSRHQAPVQLASFSRDGKILATAGKDQVIKIWDLELNQPGPTLSDHEGELLSMIFAQNDQSLITGGQDGKLRVWSWSR